MLTTRFSILIFKMMKITVLGSGTILSGPVRKPSAFLLESAGHVALLDMGPGILYQLSVLNIDFLVPDTVFITHFHLDHCSDLFPYLMSRYLLDNGSNKRFKIFGPVGLHHWYETNASLQGKWLNDCKPDVIEIFNNNIQWADQKVLVYPTGHTNQSIAYRFEGQKKIFFSGDTGFNEELISFALNAELGVLECSHPDEKPVAGHLTPKEAGRFAQLAGFKELAVCHMYPENDTKELSQKLAMEYQGKLIIPEDLDVF